MIYIQYIVEWCEQKAMREKKLTTKPTNSTFEIEGLAGSLSLEGEIEVKGGKNSALVALPAAILFADALEIANIPQIEDVYRMAELLSAVGFEIETKDESVMKVSCSEVSKVKTLLTRDIVSKIRASIFVTGPLLARFGKVTFVAPGGDNIGPRPFDLFIDAYKKMGASVSIKNDEYTLSTDQGVLNGADIFLRVQSVGATQTIMLSAILAKGTTTIQNAALEPEIVALAQFLNSCGAKISGIGTTTLKIEGTGLLKAKGNVHAIIPDRLETGTFLILGVLCAKDITIVNCVPEHVGALIEILKKCTSSKITVSENSIRVQNDRDLEISAIDVRTHEYPGLATDLQPPLVVLLTQATGKSLVFETLYEERFNYVGNLVQMGANIKVYDSHRIRVRGKTNLTYAQHTGPDVRGGLAYVLAAIIAKGTSVIHNVYVVDRGYEKIEERFKKIGVSIKRKSQK